MIPELDSFSGAVCDIEIVVGATTSGQVALNYPCATNNEPEFLLLSPDQADALARSLKEMATKARSVGN